MTGVARPRAGWIALVLLALGTCLRLRQYWPAPPLWGDEAMVAINICARTYRGLLTPLTFDQTAPIGFLWLEHAAVQAFGAGEQVLRALPLAAGIGLLFAFHRLTARLLDRTSALAALAVMAVSPRFIEYTNDVKPYTGDALLATLAALAVLSVIDRPRPSAWWRLIATGSVAAASSIPAPMMLAGAIAIPAGPSRRGGRLRWWALAAGAWAAIYGAIFFWCYRTGSSEPSHEYFWASRFLRFGSPSAVLADLSVLGRWLGGVVLGVGVPLRHWLSYLLSGLLILVVFGARRILKDRGWPAVVVCASPIAAMVSFSAVEAYPIDPRTALFTAPLAMALVIAGIRDAVAWLMPRQFAIGVIGLAGLLFAYPIGLSAYRIAVPYVPDSSRTLVDAFVQSHGTGEPIYVAGRAVAVWLFYTTDWRSPDLDRIHRLSSLVSWQGEAFRALPTRGRAVSNEGRSLVFPARDWLELIGIGPGMGPGPGSIATAEPDRGWAENEAARIVAAARPVVWVLSGDAADVLPVLRQALTAAGLRLEESHTIGESALLKYRLTPSSSR